MNPLTAITGRLAWGRDGTCWAFSHVPALAYAVAGPDAQRAALDTVHAALSGFAGHFALWGLCRPIGDDELEVGLVGGRTRPAWVAARRADVAALDPYTVRFRRDYFVAVTVDVTWRPRLAVDGRAAVPPAAVVERALRDARVADRRLGPLGATAATAADVAWIVERTWTRGSVDLPPGAAPDVLCGDRLADLADCWAVNGGQPDDDRHGWSRWVRIDGPHGRGYQTAVVIERAPAAYDPPGSAGEWLARVERDLDFPVDWHVRGVVEDRVRALSKIRWKLRAVAGQHDEQADDAAGVPPAVYESYEALKDQEADITRSGQAPLVWSTVFTVAATDPTVLEDRAERLIGLFAGQDYALARRLGRQRALVAAQTPCAPYRWGAALWPYRLHTGVAGLTGAAPFCGSVGGDPSGLLLAVDYATGLRTPRLFQPGHAAATNTSPTVILCGELGSGKSKTAKKIVVEGLLPAGGQFIGIDATASVARPDGTLVGEWVALADHLPDAEVVDVTGGTVSLDVLGWDLPTGAARKMLTEALAVACGYDDDSREADLLAKVVADVDGRGGRAADLPAALAAYPDPKAAEVVDRLATRVDYLPAIFDRGRRPPRLDAAYLVFSACGLTLPTWAEMTNPELARKVPRQKRCGSAILLIVTSIAKHLGWSAPGRSTLIGMDEAWRVTANPAGADTVTEITTEGRRYDTGLLIGIQNPDRLPVDVRSFAGQVLAFRARGDAAAAAGALVGVDPERIVDLAHLTGPDGQPLSGFCYWRSTAGQTTFVRVLRPVDPTIDAATETTPTPAED